MTRTRRILATFSVAFFTLVGNLSAQTPSARQAYEEGLRQAQAGDTLGAIGSMDRAVELDPSFARAYYQKGMLYFARASSKTFQFEERLQAQKAFQAALKLDPGNPDYLVSLGKLMLMQQVRVDAQRVFQRALLEAERAKPGTLAEVHYQLAIYREAQWHRFKYRYRLPPEVTQVSGELAYWDPRYVWDLLDRSRTWQGQGEEQRVQMLHHLNQALAANPAHVGAASHLLSYYYEIGDLDRYMVEARRFARAAPSEPKAYLALGLGLHAQGRDDEASGAFDFALELMPKDQRQDFEAVGRLMKKDDAEVFDSLQGEARQNALRRFWVGTDPLYLTPSNEYWVEYLARMAYADLRFGLPEYDVPGWRTDRGTIWVRYGPPVRRAMFSPDVYDSGDMEAAGKVTTVWSYGRQGPVFMFRQNPGFRRATFANDFRFYAEDFRETQPSSFSAPSIPALVQIPAQVARFRGDDGGMDIEVHAAIPLDSLQKAVELKQATLETGFFVVAPGGSEIRRVVQNEDVDFDKEGHRWLRSWRTEVPAGPSYLVSVEARDPLSWAAAHNRTTVLGKRFPPGEPSASDMLLVHDLKPLVEKPTQRNQIRMTPEPTMAFQPDEQIGVYFELYNFLPDKDQYASYELELEVRVEEIYREGVVHKIFGELADKWGLTEEGRQAVRLRYSKEDRVVARDMIPEYFTIGMDEPPPGRYGLTLQVTDRNAQRQFTIQRTFEILDNGEGGTP